MAPRRGGGSSGGSSGSGSTCDSDWPCTSELNFIYGNRPASLWTNSNLYGQLVPAAIFAVALLVLCFFRRKGVRQGWSLLTSMLLFIAGFIFLCVRYGIIIGEANVAIGYRFEHSVVVLLHRLAMPLLLLAAHEASEPGMASRIVYGVGVSIYAVLNVVYAVFDFLVSADGLEDFKENTVWRLGDRDFAVTMDASMIRELKTGATGTGLNPSYVRSRLFDPLADDPYMTHRDMQVKIGVAAEVFALLLVLLLGALVVLTVWRRRESFFKRNGLLFIAVGGLLLTTLFQLVVAVHYVFNNWRVINNFTGWFDFQDLYPERASVFDTIRAPDGFLEGYRITVNSFPVVQAVLVPLGIVIACAAVTWLNFSRPQKVAVVHNGEQKYEQPYQGQAYPPAQGYPQSYPQGYAAQPGYR